MKNEIFASYKGTLADKILPTADFKLFSDLGGFKIDPSYNEAIIKDAEKYLDYTYKVLPASVYMQFKRNGNRSNYEAICFERRRAVSSLLLGEYVERKGRFTDKLIDGVWLMLEETTWVLPAHNLSKPGVSCPLSYAYKEYVDYIDLFSAEAGSLMAWVWYLGADFLDAETPLIRDRLLYELNRRIITPYLTNDTPWWMGKKGNSLNNWTPWIVSNVLAVAALICDDDSVREQIVEISLTVLDRFTSFYHDDGGCDEGPGYWNVAGASYFDCLEILYDLSGGKIDVFSHPLVRAMGEYIAKVNICGNYFLNFADAHARVSPDMFMIERFGSRVGSETMKSFAASDIAAHNRRASLSAQYRHLKNIALPPPAAMQYICFDKVWLDGIEIMVRREKPIENEGLYLAAKGGCNAESHNHNDVGSFMVYADGKPIFIDVGVGTYTAKTFSSQRYTIWTMQSCYHNLPTINGKTQPAGGQYRAENIVYDDAKGLSMSLASCYPSDSGIKSYTRSFALENGEIRITDDISLDGEGQVEFNLVTPDKPDLSVKGEIGLRDGRKAFYDASLSAELDEIELDDRSISNAWQCEKLYRIRLGAKSIGGVYTLTVK